jgi:hypothetical protein
MSERETPIPGQCIGERCGICGEQAMAKVEEVIFDGAMRHPLTQYLCADHASMVLQPYNHREAGCPFCSNTGIHPRFLMSNADLSSEPPRPDGGGEPRWTMDEIADALYHAELEFCPGEADSLPAIVCRKLNTLYRLRAHERPGEINGGEPELRYTLRCGRCGSPVAGGVGGHGIVCTNPTCIGSGLAAAANAWLYGVQEVEVAHDVGGGAHGADGGDRPEVVTKAEKGGDKWTPRYREDAEEETPRASPPGDKGGPNECEGNDADPLPAVRTGQPRLSPNTSTSNSGGRSPWG